MTFTENQQQKVASAQRSISYSHTQDVPSCQRANVSTINVPMNNHLIYMYIGDIQ